MTRDQNCTLALEAIREIFINRGPDFHVRVLHNLERAYGDPHRHYHTMRHIGECLMAAKKFEFKDRKAFLAAILFHDVLYEIHRYDPSYKGESNEQASAKICEQVLIEGGVDQAVIDRTKKLIIMTQNHKVPEGDDEAQLFIDIDMSIVGASRERYQEYCPDVYREYLTLFPAKEFTLGRLGFLVKLDDETKIFKTAQYADRNQVAVDNMRWERQNIESIVARAVALNLSSTFQPGADYR